MNFNGMGTTLVPLHMQGQVITSRELPFAQVAFEGL